MSKIDVEVLDAPESEGCIDDTPATPRVGQRSEHAHGVVTGTLVGFTEESRPLVLYAAQSGRAAVAAATIVDLHGSHIGHNVLLTFEDGNLRRPVVLGVLRTPHARALAEQPGTVEVDADGERLVMTAKYQLVLRCGKASITLTKAGKVLIEGTYVSNRSAGVMRIKGGSVQIN
jgi:hypothetical protein